jgi:3-isopropylmalate/(R)-2-methylmalate dehydratase small subunit
LNHYFRKWSRLNAINCGLVALECDTSRIQSGDELEINLTTGKINDLTQNFTIEAAPLPEVMIQILNEGGLVSYFKKHGSFPEPGKSQS